jgi:hypothetical protein
VGLFQVQLPKLCQSIASILLWIRDSPWGSAVVFGAIGAGLTLSDYRWIAPLGADVTALVVAAEANVLLAAATVINAARSRSESQVLASLIDVLVRERQFETENQPPRKVGD